VTVVGRRDRSGGSRKVSGLVRVDVSRGVEQKAWAFFFTRGSLRRPPRPRGFSGRPAAATAADKDPPPTGLHCRHRLVFGRWWLAPRPWLMRVRGAGCPRPENGISPRAGAQAAGRGQGRPSRPALLNARAGSQMVGPPNVHPVSSSHFKNCSFVGPARDRWPARRKRFFGWDHGRRFSPGGAEG